MEAGTHTESPARTGASPAVRELRPAAGHPRGELSVPGSLCGDAGPLLLAWSRRPWGSAPAALPALGRPWGGCVGVQTGGQMDGQTSGARFHLLTALSRRGQCWSSPRGSLPHTALESCCDFFFFFPFGAQKCRDQIWVFFPKPGVPLPTTPELATGEAYTAQQRKGQEAVKSSSHPGTPVQPPRCPCHR